MNILLDTHTLIWFLEGSDNLSQIALQLIEDDKNTCHVSIVSIWEIAIKVSLKKMEMKIPFEKLSLLIWENGFQILPIEFSHTLKLISLPFHHNDPFDRLLITQSIVENMYIISKDSSFKLYDVRQLW
ncbi:MAG TPA: PIN domain nuclease [Bacteroidales bacterium]|nr:PIN domain nuclease [Bacteroidales bacterium]